MVLFSTLAVLISVCCGASNIWTTTGLSDRQNAMVVKQVVHQKLQYIHRNMPRALRSLQQYSDVYSQVTPISTEETRTTIRENTPLLQTTLTSSALANRNFTKFSNNNSVSLMQETTTWNAPSSPVFWSSSKLTNVSPRNASIYFKPLFCHRDDDKYINFRRLEIHHWDLPERSVVACGDLCLQLHPSTELVFAKIIDMNEMLVCGCGDSAAVYGNGAGVMGDSCFLCPDGDQKCGGPSSVSVYEVNLVKPEPHNLNYLGCYQEEDVRGKHSQKYLLQEERSVAACGLHCSKGNGEPELVMITMEESRLKCICG